MKRFLAAVGAAVVVVGAAGCGIDDAYACHAPSPNLVAVLDDVTAGAPLRGVQLVTVSVDAFGGARFVVGTDAGAAGVATWAGVVDSDDRYTVEPLDNAAAVLSDTKVVASELVTSKERDAVIACVRAALD